MVRGLVSTPTVTGHRYKGDRLGWRVNRRGAGQQPTGKAHICPGIGKSPFGAHRIICFSSRQFALVSFNMLLTSSLGLMFLLTV